MVRPISKVYYCFIKLSEISFTKFNTFIILRICSITQFSSRPLTYVCQVGEVQKREISLFASWKRWRFCAKPFRDIYFVHQRSNSGWNFENVEIFPPLNSLKLFIWCKILYFCTWWTLCWLSNAFSLENSIQFPLFKEKIIGRRWGPKRGSFPLLGWRWMFRREMGSKRGSLPPKEGDLTCMRWGYM